MRVLAGWDFIALRVQEFGIAAAYGVLLMVLSSAAFLLWGARRRLKVAGLRLAQAARRADQGSCPLQTSIAELQEMGG